MVSHNSKRTEVRRASVAPQDLYIRKMNIADLKSVCALDGQIFVNPWPADSFVYEIRENRLSHPYVIEKAGEIIGYCVYWGIDDETHIAILAIAQPYRRQHIGRFFLDYLLRKMKTDNVQVVHLEVRESNSGAQQFYLRHGFKVVGVRKNYYSKEHENALLMSKYLA